MLIRPNVYSSSRTRKTDKYTAVSRTKTTDLDQTFEQSHDQTREKSMDITPAGRTRAVHKRDYRRRDRPKAGFSHVGVHNAIGTRNRKTIQRQSAIAAGSNAMCCIIRSVGAAHLRVREKERLAEQGCIDSSRDKPAVEFQTFIEGRYHVSGGHASSLRVISDVEHLPGSMYQIQQ